MGNAGPADHSWSREPQIKPDCLVQACLRGDRSSFDALLARADVNVNGHDDVGWTALCAATIMERTWFVQRLLEVRGREVDIDHTDRLGWTALALAVARLPASKDIVLLLLNHGAFCRLWGCLQFIYASPPLEPKPA